MKKVIVFIVFLNLVPPSSFAGEIVKTPMLDYLPTTLDMAFEIKTSKYDSVILDCQSFFKEVRFTSSEMNTLIYLDEDLCYELHDFFFTSKRDNLPVCLGVDSENSELFISREVDECK